MKSLLKIRNLQLGFKATPSNIVLSNCESLDLCAGSLVCLMGANGSGKSTLINAIGGEPILSGEITLEDSPIHHYTSEALAKKMAFVYTDKIDVDYLSVEDIIELGRFPYSQWKSKLSKEDKTIINQAIDAMEVRPFLKRELSSLSDGERQRTLIARAIAQDPQILLLDEPTSFLDLPHKVKTLKLLRNWSRKQNRAVLLSTHDLSLAMSIADEIWLMTPYKKIIYGAPEDLMLSGEIEKTFCTKDIRINPIDGNFEIVEPILNIINLTGKSCPWTKKALARIGYGIAGNNQYSPLVLDVIENKYRLKNNKRYTEQSFKTLLELINHLKSNEKY